MENILHWYLLGVVLNMVVVYVSFVYDLKKKRVHKLRVDDYVLFFIAIVMSWLFYLLLIVNGFYYIFLKVSK